MARSLMPIDCRQAEAAMDAWLAESLDSGEERALRRHTSECPACRRRWQELRAGLDVLQSAAGCAPPRNTGSLWPRIACRIPHTHRPAPRAPIWHVWAAAGLATLILAVVLTASPRESESMIAAPRAAAAAGQTFDAPVPEFTAGRPDARRHLPDSGRGERVDPSRLYWASEGDSSPTGTPWAFPRRRPAVEPRSPWLLDPRLRPWWDEFVSRR